MKLDDPDGVAARATIDAAYEWVRRGDDRIRRRFEGWLPAVDRWHSDPPEPLDADEHDALIAVVHGAESDLVRAGLGNARRWIATIPYLPPADDAVEAWAVNFEEVEPGYSRHEACSVHANIEDARTFGEAVLSAYRDSDSFLFPHRPIRVYVRPHQVQDLANGGVLLPDGVASTGRWISTEGLACFEWLKRA